MCLPEIHAWGVLSRRHRHEAVIKWCRNPFIVHKHNLCTCICKAGHVLRGTCVALCAGEKKEIFDAGRIECTEKPWKGPHIDLQTYVWGKKPSKMVRHSDVASRWGIDHHGWHEWEKEKKIEDGIISCTVARYMAGWKRLSMAWNVLVHAWHVECTVKNGYKSSLPLLSADGSMLAFAKHFQDHMGEHGRLISATLWASLETSWVGVAEEA